MSVSFTSPVHIFSIDDLTGTFSGITYAEDPGLLDTAGAVIDPYFDKDGNALFGMDSEFGFYVTDFIGAEDKVLDGDHAEGFAGNIYGATGTITGLSVYNAPTDIFRSGAPLGTWSLGLGGTTVKASTEHYVTMSDLLSDQAHPGDGSAIAPLDDDLKMLDLRPTGTAGVLEVGAMHQSYVRELAQALQKAMANTLNDQTRSDIDFDRDGVNDTYRTLGTEVQADIDGDGTIETLLVGGVDLDADGKADIVDSWLNGFGGTADITDLLQPNESSVTYDIAHGEDYSVTLKDDGKLLYRWGEAVKRPNDIRMEVNLALPDEWTADEDGNGIADSLEDGSGGFTVTRAELVITHDITNNPNDQVRPEDYENEAAIGRLPSHYIVTDPDDASNTLWVSPVDTYSGEGTFLPSYFKLDAAGNVDNAAGGIPVFDPNGTRVGYRNVDATGTPIGTVLRDLSLVAKAEAAGLDFTTEDLAEGFTPAWYTTTDREPFEWSYDRFPANPNVNVYESFRSADEATAAGHDAADVVSGPRWRLTPNKFGQDLPGLEVPLEPNSKPPFQKDNIKYDTGTLTTTTLNLLDWEGTSPLSNSIGWMAIDPGRVDENGDGLIDEGWKDVNGTLGAGDALPGGLILSAVSPNGVTIGAGFLDTAIYVKGDRQDSAKLYDIQLVVEYESDAPPAVETTIGAVQQVTELDHIAKTVAYQNGTSFENPVAFATPASLNGFQPVTVGLSGVGATGATLHLEEPEFYDGKHVDEEVTLLTLEEGVWTLADGSLLQVGTATFEAGATDVFHSVTFDVAFEDAPVILLQVQTSNDDAWDIVRAQNVGTTGFEYAAQEQEAGDGFHMSEVVGWAALDAASADGIVDWNGMMGQAFATGEAVDHKGDEFEFNAKVGTNPLISAVISTFTGPDSANLRLDELSHDGTSATARFVVQEDQSFDSEVQHREEGVTGLAFEEAGILSGVDYSLDLLIA
jgi:hypothetical protein